jgi:hypothetical protein
MKKKKMMKKKKKMMKKKMKMKKKWCKIFFGDKKNFTLKTSERSVDFHRNSSINCLVIIIIIIADRFDF